jgi:hypothetical protein
VRASKICYTKFAREGSSKKDLDEFHDCPCVESLSVRVTLIDSPRMDGYTQTNGRSTHGPSIRQAGIPCLEQAAGACMQVEPGTIAVCQRTQPSTQEESKGRKTQYLLASSALITLRRVILAIGLRERSLQYKSTCRFSPTR